MIGDDEIDATATDVQPSQEDNDELMLSADVFIHHSLSGVAHPHSLCSKGSINDIVVHVLIDGESINNFIYPHNVECLQLSLTYITPFRVYVGNEQLTVVPLVMQDNTFPVDLYFLAIHRPDVFPNVQWIQLLGTVAHNYAQLTMSFL